MVYHNEYMSECDIMPHSTSNMPRANISSNKVMNILIIREKSIKLFKIIQNFLFKLQFLIISKKIDYYIILN